MKNNLKKLLALLVAAVTIGWSATGNVALAANQTGGGTPWVNSELKENVKSSTRTNPVDDFHLYVNKEWLTSSSLPDGYSRYSHYTECSLRTQNKALAMLQSSTLSDADAVELSALYNKVLDWDTRNKEGMLPLMEDLAVIDSIKTMADLYNYMCDTTTETRNTFFNMYASADPDDATTNVLHVDDMGFLLSDPAEYTELTESGHTTMGYQRALFEYMMQRMGYSVNDADIIYDSAIAMDARFATDAYATEDYYSSDYTSKSKNRYTLTQLISLCKNYPMARVLKAYGVSGAKTVIVSNPAEIKNMDSLMTSDNLTAIKNILKVNAVISKASCLDEACYRTKAELLNEYYGTTGSIADEKMALLFVSTYLPIQYQREYVKLYGNAQEKALVTDMCQQVIDNYKEMLLANTDFSSTTINNAVEKLDAMQINACYPDKWPDVDYSVQGLDLCDAIKVANKYSTIYNLKKIDKKIDKDLWIDLDGGISVTECNAFYSSTDNSINMILGMMDEPFYSEDMSTEELYASLGAFWIGHEVSHAFDSAGSQYDKDGNLKSWWTDADQAKYDAKIAKVDAYLDTIKVFGDYYDSGSMIDTELVADMTGVEVALRMASKVPNFDYDKFFTKFGQMNASIGTYNSEVSQLLSDPHPLNYQRTNVPVQQFEEFYTTYNVKPGDNMYLAPEDRIVVW